MFKTRKTFSKLCSFYVFLVCAFIAVNGQINSRIDHQRINIPITVKLNQLKPVQQIQFSSVYTKLNSKTCKPLWKQTNEQDEPDEICGGYKGYKIYIQMHGVSHFYVGREISKNSNKWTSIELPSFIFSGYGQTIEWRLANGEPFACIVRVVFDKRISNFDEKGWANKLSVQNLRSFAPINFSIDATKVKRANELARRKADESYRKL